MPSRISYNIHAMALRNRSTLMAHLVKLQPVSVLVMDGLGLCREIKQAMPNCTVISRIYKDDDFSTRPTPQQWLDQRAPQAEGGIYQYTFNEVGFGQDVIDWHVRLLELAAERRVPLVIGNMSVGTPEASDWPKARRLLELLDKHRDLFILGLHEYACGVVTSGFMGGWPDNAGVEPGKPGGHNLVTAWPKREEVDSITRFHMGRFKFLLGYCQSNNILPPRIILTEHGFDDVSDIKQWAEGQPKTPPYATLRGWKSLRNAWNKWFPQWSHERAYFEQLAYADKTIYQNSPVEAQLIFSWGHTNDLWEVFDVADAGELHGLLEAYAQQPVVTPAPVKPPVIAPPTPTPAPVPVPSPTPPAPKPDWRKGFDKTELKMIDAAKYYAKDPSYPEPGSHLKKLIAKMAAELDKV